MADTEFDPDLLTDILPLYYNRLFPYDPYCRWLCSGRQTMDKREISFTLSDDIYIRYQSFSNRKELIDALQRRTPIKIDIGAVYNCRPRQSAQGLRIVEKEMVFDIDMTDYDEVRICCSGADVCTKCWKLMSIACKILDATLREDFAFEHLLWVFSGRRGIHCWVCDEAARKLNYMGRDAIAEYLNLVKGGTNKAKKVSLPREQMQHSVRRALTIVEQSFEDICLIDQDILGTDERVANFLKLVPDNDEKENFKKKIMTQNTSINRWNAFVNHWNSLKSSGKSKKSMRNLIDEIMLQYMYPRLDINVTKGMNHLLKSPFCVHPKTGKVSVPFNPKAVDKFNPLTVPTISLLASEINAYDAKTKEQEVDSGEDKTLIKDYKKTSVYKAVVVFEEFVRKLERDYQDQSMKF
ncbi:DNA primase subunit 1 [Carabus blaptoides fortunei]